MASIETDEKCLRSPAMLVICLCHRSPLLPPFVTSQLKLATSGACDVGIFFYFFFILVNRKINIRNLTTDFEMPHRHTAIIYIFIYIICMCAV